MLSEGRFTWGIGVGWCKEEFEAIGTEPFGALQQMRTAQAPGAPMRTDAAGPPTENPAHYLGLLEELHDSGVLDEAEYSAARTRLLESLRA